MIKEHLAMSVALYNPKYKKLKKLYHFISSPDEAHLLAVKAMHGKPEDDLVVILPGWNVRMTDEDIKMAEQLAEKYAYKENE